MLCFVQGFEGSATTSSCCKDNTTKDGRARLQKLVKNHILRKSRSSGNFGSAGSARSAPSTPQGLLGGPSSTGLLTGEPLVIPRSPSHSHFNKCDKASLKHLSTSTPVMTAQAQLAEPPSPKPGIKEGKVHNISKGRQKKFVRHFPTVEEDEKVLNYYSCALIGDILLQGNLYITNKYFAFYSNVFGYVTKLLIPVLNVVDITKERTARIIPNAVGIVTQDDKHIFGSLMSRDSTLQFMKKVWNKAKSENPAIVEPLVEDNTTETGEEGSGRESPILDTPPKIPAFLKMIDKEKTIVELPKKKSSSRLFQVLQDFVLEFGKLPRANLILVATTLLLTLLFLSAGVLLWRISRIQSRFPPGDSSPDMYSDLLQWQSHLHSKSAGAVHSFLDSNLDQIAKVRQNLEALSTLLIQSKPPSAETPPPEQDNS